MMEADDRQSIQTVLAFLEKCKIGDEKKGLEERTIRRVMTELSISILKPGQICQWLIEGKLVRELRVGSDGTLTNRGLTREKLNGLSGWKHYREGFPTRTNKD